MSWKFLCPKAIFCEIFNQWMENMHILFPALTLEIRVPLTTLAVNILTGYAITHNYCYINNINNPSSSDREKFVGLFMNQLP